MYNNYAYFGVCLSISLPKVHNSVHFLSTFKHPKYEILMSFSYSLLLCLHLLIKYIPVVSEVVYHNLEVVVGALNHIFALRT